MAVMPASLLLMVLVRLIHAMLLTALNPGDKLLLPRNAHRSVAGGLVLSGIDVVYMYPEYNADFALCRHR